MVGDKVAKVTVWASSNNPSIKFGLKPQQMVKNHLDDQQQICRRNIYNI